MTEIEARTSEVGRGPSSSDPSFVEADVLDDAGHVDPEALERVRGRLRDAGRWEDLVRLSTFAAERSPSARTAREAWREAGDTWRDRLGSFRRAEPFYARVLASDPDDARAIEGLRAVALSAGRWEEAADSSERLAILFRGGPRAAEYWVEAADLARTKLAHPERALRALARARTEDPSRRDVLERALDLLIEEERWQECVRVLEDHEALLESASPAARADLAARYREVGVILAEHALHHRTAEVCLTKARELGDSDALSRLDQLAAQRADWRGRARALLAEGLEARDKRRAAQLYVQAAEMHHVYGRDPVKAEEHLNRALILKGYRPALAYLETSFLAQGRPEELIKRLNALLAGVRDAPTRIEVSLRIARLMAQLGPRDGRMTQTLVAIFERILALEPGHREATRACTVLLAEAGLHEQRARVLENHLAALTDEYAKVTIHLQLGRLYAEVLGDSSRARAHFEAVMAARPTHYSAATALRALYRDADEAPLLLDVLRVLLEYMPDIDTRRRLLDEMASVAASTSAEDQYAVARRRFDLFPADRDVEADFTARSEALQRDLTLAQSLERAAARLPEERAVELLRKAARVYDDRLPRPEDAVRCLRSALALAPDDTAMQEDLERLLRQQDDPQSLAELLEAQLRRTFEPDKQIVLGSKLGEVLFKELNDLEGAAARFEEILTRDPAHPTALAQLDDLYRAKGDATAREAILARRERVFADSDARMQIQAERARLLATELGRPEEAVDLYLELLEHQPDRTDHVEALDRLLARGVREVEVARALERSFARRGEYSRQVEMLAVLVRREMDASARKELALRAAHLCDARLGAYGPAFDYLAIALALDPADDAVKDHLLEASHRLGAPDRAVRVFETVLERDDLEPPVIASLAQAAAEIRERELDDPDGAIAAYRRVLAVDAAASSAVASLQRILSGQGRHEELAKLLAAQLEVAEGEADRSQLWMTLADVREHDLGDVEGAIEALRRASTLQPEDRAIQVRLADLLERAGRRRELVNVLTRMADGATAAEEKAAAWARMGDALRGEGEHTRALDCYAAAIDQVPDHPSATAGLESCLDEPPVAGRAGRIASPLLADQGRVDAWAKALDASVSTYAPGPERARVLAELAGVHRDRRADPAAAFDAWTRAFREAPDDSVSLERWEEAAVAARRARELAGIWSEAAEAEDAPVELLRRLARLWDGPAAEPARAKEVWERIRNRAPGDVEALEALERLTASTDPERLVEILEARAEVESDPDAKVALHRRAAALAEESLDDVARAVDQLERADALRPADSALLAELTRVYELVGATEPRRRALERRIDLQTAPVARADAIVALGSCQVEFQELEAAVGTYGRALDEVADHEAARQGLEALLESPVARAAAEALEPVYRRLGNWSRLVEVYEARARHTEDPADALEQWVAIRSMWEDRLGRAEPAFEAALECVRLDPEEPGHWAALERLAAAANGVERVVARSEERIASASDDERPMRAVDHAERLERLGVEGPRVAAAWDEVRALSPGHPDVQDALARHFERAGRLRELAETLGARALLVSGAEQVELLRRAGALWMDRLAAPEEAIQSLERVLEQSPEDEDVLARLESLYTKTRRPEARAEILERWARTGSREERGARLIELSRVRSEELRDPSGALPPLEDAVREGAPEALDALEALMRSARSSHPHVASRAAAALLEPLRREAAGPRLAEALDALAGGSDDPEARFAARTERARVCETQLEDPGSAFEALAEAHRDRPHDGQVIEELERLAELAGRTEALADLFSQTASASEDPELRARLARAAAVIYEALPDRTDAAWSMVRIVRAYDPSDPQMRAALERLAERRGDGNERIALYRESIDETPAGPDRAPLWLEIARIAEHVLDDDDIAYDAYRGWAESGGADEEAARRYRALCERSGRWDELAELLASDAQAAATPEEAKPIWLRLAVVHRDQRDDAQAAVDAFAAALDARPGDEGGLAGLATVMQSTPAVAGRAARLFLRHVDPAAVEERASAHAVAAETGADLEDRVEHWLEASRLVESARGPDPAFDYAVRALYEDPSDDDVRARVEACAEAAGRWGDLTNTYQSVLAASPDPRTARLVHTRLAQRHEAEGDSARAVAEYQMALEHAPEDAATLEALERLLEGEGDFERLSDVFRRRIASTEDPRHRASLMRQFADLLALRMGDFGAAISTLRRLLELEPNDQAALMKLDRWLAEQGRGSERREVLERLVAASEDPSVRLDARLRWAQLETDELKDPTRGLALAEENLSETPGHAATRAWLQERADAALAARDRGAVAGVTRVLRPAFEATGDGQAAIALTRACVELTPDPSARADLLASIADTYDRWIGQPDLSFATLIEAIRLAPGRVDLRERAQSIAKEQELVEDLVDAYLEIAPACADPEAAIAILRHAARALDELAEDPDRSEATWSEIHRRSPDDPEASSALEAHARRRDDPHALARALEERLERTEDAKRFFVTSELGRLYAERLGDRSKARAHLRSAHSIDPEDRSVALALARVLDATDDAAELYAVFEHLERSATRPADKIPVLLRMGHLAETALQRSDDALQAYGRVLRLDERNDHAFRGLERLYEGSGRWGDLGSLLEARLATSTDPNEVTELQRKLGAVRASHLGSPEEAIAAWGRVLDARPNDEEALAALRELMRRQERWEGLVGVLRRLLTVRNDPEAIKSVRFELAEVLLDHLGSSTEAVDVARRILEIEPQSTESLLQLEALLIRAGAYGEAVKVKTRRAESSSDVSERIRVLEEVAELYESRIRRTAGAIETHERILELEPHHEAAFDALCRLYDKHGDHRSLVDLLGRKLRRADDPKMRGRLHLKVADLQERALGSKDLAFAAACAAFSEGGATPDAEALMRRLASETDNVDMMVDVLEDQVDEVSLERGLELRLEVARLARDEEPERAERHLEMLLAMHPGHPDGAELLEEILRAQERWSDLVLHLRDQAELVSDDAQVRALLERVAGLEERELGRRDAAIRTWSEIHDRYPTEVNATGELERLYRDDGRSRALLDLLERRLESASPEARVETLLQMARLREHDLDQSEHAIEHLQSVLEIDPGHADALRGLERLFVAGERWTELLAVFEKQLTVAATPEDSAGILTRMAAVHEERLSDPTTAAATYERVLEVLPEHEGAARALLRLARTEGRHRRRGELLEILRQRTGDPAERIELTRELAVAYARELEDADAAERLFRELLDEDPTSIEALQGLAEIAERQGRWTDAIDFLSRRADILPPADAVAIHQRVGEIARDELGDPVAARAAFERALDADARFGPSLSALRALAESDGDAGRVLELLEREASATTDPQERAALYHEAAELALESFDDVDRAVKTLERALDAVPAHRPSLSDITELLFSDEQYDAAVPHLDRLIDVLDPEVESLELGRLHYRRAYVAERNGDAEAALRHYHASFEADSSYLPTLEGLAAALVEADRLEDAQRIYQTILVQHRESLTDAEVVDLHHEVGDLATRLGQLDRAKRSLVKALELDPRHVETLGSLAELSEQLDEVEDAYDFRERMIDQLSDPQARYEALMRQGDLCRDRIREPYRAIDAFTGALAERPGDLEAQRALAPLYEATRQFGSAVRSLAALAELVDDPNEQRDLWIRAGDLQWRKERSWEGADEAYNRALDIDPGFSAALERIEAMLAEAKQWRALEENYIRMIRRLPKEATRARVALWKSLGELYTRVLDDPAGAARAYEVVFSLDPGDPDVGITLARIYRRQPSRRAEAAQICRRVLPAVSDPVPAARLFAELSYESGDYDPAFCGLGALMLARAAQEEEVRAYRAMLDKTPAWPAGGVSDGQWKRVLLHPGCRGPLGAMVATVYRHAPDLFSGPRRAAALKKKERVDLADKGKNAPVRLRYFDVWARVAGALGLRDVEHYRRPGSVDPPILLPGSPKPVLYVGENHEVFKTMPVRQIAWLVGRQVAAARPEIAPLRALSLGDFLAMAEATLQIFDASGGYADQIDPRVLAAWTKALRSQLPDAARSELEPHAAEVVRQGGLQSASAYAEAAEHSASRAALLVSGDWITASRGLGEADALIELPRDRRVRELIVFSCSNDLASLREALSLKVQV